MFPLLGFAAWEAFAEGVALAVSVYKAVKGQFQSYRQEVVCMQIEFWPILQLFFEADQLVQTGAL